jgi:hypothetical protein
MRGGELRYGLELEGASDRDKRRAGRRAVFRTMLSRMIMPAPIILFPAMGSYLLQGLGLWPTAMFGKHMADMALSVASMAFALPMSLALFERDGQIKSKSKSKDDPGKVYKFNCGF